MRYGFLDESGGVDPFAKQSPCLVVAVLTTARPRSIELHIKRAHKKYGTSLASGEMKAAFSKERVIKRLLLALAVEDVAIVAVTLNKEVIVRPPKDPEDLYREAVNLAVRRCVERWPRLEMYLDKRYNRKKLVQDLERGIRENIADLPQEVVLIYQEDSVVRKELQAADFVAWALYQRCMGNQEFWRLIEDKVIEDEVIERAKWVKKISGSPWGPITTGFSAGLGAFSEGPATSGFTIPLR